MKKRLFVAIPLSEYFRNIFLAYQERQKKDWTMATDRLRIKWTAPENLHITVYFLGDTDEHTIDKIVSKLRGVLFGVQAFELKFEKVSLAPPHRPPRMIWAMFSESEEYKKLIDVVYGALAEFVAEDNRHKEYIPHVTLARFRDSSAARGIDLQQPNIEHAMMRVSSCDFMESKLSRNGPSYRVVASFALG